MDSSTKPIPETAQVRFQVLLITAAVADRVERTHQWLSRAYVRHVNQTFKPVTELPPTDIPEELLRWSHKWTFGAEVDKEALTVTFKGPGVFPVALFLQQILKWEEEVLPPGLALVGFTWMCQETWTAGGALVTPHGMSLLSTEQWIQEQKEWETKLVRQVLSGMRERI